MNAAETTPESGHDGSSEQLLVAAQQRDELIRQKLGESRYADYRRSNDYTFRGLIELVDRFGVRPDAATQIYNLREDVLQQVRALHRNASAGEMEAPQTLQRLRTDVERFVHGQLGDGAYQQYTGLPIGSWIGDITRQLPWIP